MYEEKRIEFDWKGFLLKLAFLIIVIILIIKLLPLDNKNTSKELSTEFKNNMATLREKSTVYFNGDKLPINSDESAKVSLDDLVKVGAVRSLNDTKGNSCDLKNSYVKATNKTNGYELEIHLTCGKEADTAYVYLTNEEGDKNTTTTTTTTKSISDNSTTKNNNTNNSGGSTKKPAETITSKIVKTTKAATHVSVIFNTDGGTSVATQSVQIGKAAIRPTNPTKSGYTFLGWYYNNKEYNFNSAVNSNIILKAKWLLNNTNTTKSTTKKTTTTTTTTKSVSTKYVVTFNSNGGSSRASKIVEYGNYVSKPIDPVKSNAVFMGWYLNGKIFNFNTRIYSNITLVAKYISTETLTTYVYSAGWGGPTNTFKVSHTLAVPSEIADSEHYSVRIKSYEFVRGLSTANDLYNYDKFHKSTFIYSGNNADYTSAIASNFATINTASIYKTSTNKYDNGITWTGNVSKTCSKSFNYLDTTNACLYGILYKVVWEYEIIR